MQSIKKIFLTFSFVVFTLFPAVAMDSSDDDKYDKKWAPRYTFVEPPQEPYPEEFYFIDPVSQKNTSVPYVNNYPNGFQSEDVTRQNSFSNQPTPPQKD